MKQMVFGEKPSYADVLDNFIRKSEKILYSLETTLVEPQPA